jgi:hypothetical protein
MLTHESLDVFGSLLQWLQTILGDLILGHACSVVSLELLVEALVGCRDTRGGTFHGITKQSLNLGGDECTCSVSALQGHNEWKLAYRRRHALDHL